MLHPEVVTPERRPVDAEKAARVVAAAAARIPTSAGGAGNAGDRAHVHAAAAVTLDANADANPGGPRLGQPLAQIDDRLGAQTRDRGDARRRILENPRAKRIPSSCVRV